MGWRLSRCSPPVLCRMVTGVRVSPEAEVDGLDFHLHGEALEA